MQKHRVQLPARNKMLQRLRAVSSEPALVERFYPLLLREAGQMKNGHGIVLMLILAIDDYTVDAVNPHITRGLVMERFREYVGTMTTNPRVLADAEEKMKQLNI